MVEGIGASYPPDEDDLKRMKQDKIIFLIGGIIILLSLIIGLLKNG